MKSTMTLFILLLLSFFSYAQSPFPTASDSVTWTVCHTVYSPVAPDSYIYEKKINMVEWANVCGLDYSLIQDSNNNAYVRNDSMRVYLRMGVNCLEKEYLMYDFSLNVGDTVLCGWNLDLRYYSDTTQFWVTQVDTINQKRVLTMEYFPLYPDLSYVKTMTWTVGIGSNEHPFYPISTALDYCECSQSNCGINDFIVEVPYLKPIVYQVYPNPVNGKLFVQCKTEYLHESYFSISDVTGKKILLKTITNNSETIDLTNLSTGVYIVTVENKYGNVWREKIIKN
jgi:hypothetical protein